MQLAIRPMKKTCRIIGLKLSWTILDKIINNMLLEELIRVWDGVPLDIAKGDISSKKKWNWALQEKLLTSQAKEEVECVEHRHGGSWSAGVGWTNECRVHRVPLECLLYYKRKGKLGSLPYIICVSFSYKNQSFHLPCPQDIRWKMWEFSQFESLTIVDLVRTLKDNEIT